MFNDSNTTVAELKTFLDQHGVTYDSRATKSELIELANAVDVTAEPSDQDDSTEPEEEPDEDEPDEETPNDSEGSDEEPLDPDGDSDEDEIPEPVEVPDNTYTVLPGDNIAVVATRFGLTVGKLREMNEPLGFVLEPGRVLIIR